MTDTKGGFFRSKVDEWFDILAPFGQDHTKERLKARLKKAPTTPFGEVTEQILADGRIESTDRNDKSEELVQDH
jgi:hypothetical protein